MLKVLFYLTVLSLSLGQFAAVSKSGGTNVYLFDALVAFSALVNTMYLLAVPKKFSIPKPFVFLFCFIVVGIVSLFINSWRFSSDELVAAGFYAVRFLAYVLFGLSLYNLVLIGKFSTRQVLMAFVYSAVLLVLVGFVQLVLLPDFEQLDPTLGWDPHKNRLASTFFDPNFVGAYLVLALTVYALKFRKQNLSSFMIIGLLLIGILLTFSRSAWLMLAAVIFMYGLFKNPKILLISAVVAFLAYYSTPRIQTRIAGATDPADSAALRFVSWNNTAEIIKDNALFGVGFNSLRPIQLAYGFVDPDTLLGHAVAGSDSSLLFVWAASGVFGLLLFLAAVLHPLYAFRLKTSNAQLYKFMILPLLAQSVFINSLFYPQILVLWVSCLAFSYLQD